MTEREARIVRLEDKIELYHFSLSQCRDALHRVMYERAIRDAQGELNRITVVVK